MNHYSAFLRPSHGKSTNNENDENSSIKNLFLKHLTKSQQNALTNNSGKGTTRGILSDVGNRQVPNKSTVIEQCVETKAILTVPAQAASLPIIVSKIEEITLNDKQQKAEPVVYEPFTKLAQVPPEFDCDTVDQANIITASEYVVDICLYWRELEQKTPIRQNYLLNRAEGTASPQNRAVLIDWLYQVHDRFKLLSDTFHMTIQLIDRYLQIIDASKHELQLIGSTALLIACKYEEMTIPGMNDFVYVSDNAYSKEEMKEMERRIISTLSYDLGRPLSINFLRRYSKIVQATDIEHTLGKYLLDLTFTDHSFSHLCPSYISACASFLSRYLFAYKRLTSTTSINALIELLWPSQFMQYHTNYTFDQLRPGIEQLGQLLIAQETTKLRSVQKKFSQSNLFSVAQHSYCKGAYVQTALARLSK
ncbi:unnamed protein product [Adineta ricciae]|uniref:Uncharacterized protein n=1 Tax=Adineta ricciae TaxID=249248 RepID=A0A814U6F4_ADIRI|nr:unnamed protein product [Adineta ricciae]CAF1563636.1 unnamed protein product [Adineta ricciae]